MGRVWLPWLKSTPPSPNAARLFRLSGGLTRFTCQAWGEELLPQLHSFSLNSFHIFKHRPFIKFSLISPFEGAIRSCWHLDCAQSRFPKALPCREDDRVGIKPLLCVLGCGIDSKVIFLLWHPLPFLEI